MVYKVCVLLLDIPFRRFEEFFWESKSRVRQEGGLGGSGYFVRVFDIDIYQIFGKVLSHFVHPKICLNSEVSVINSLGIRLNGWTVGYQG
jgi:hypothetical protein